MAWDHKQSLKEVIKHLLFRSGAQRALYAYRRKRGYVTQHLDSLDATDRFRNVYRLGVWTHRAGQESQSGLGSELASAMHLVSNLPALLEKLECKVLLDVGCGDWNWMSHVRLPCDYIGADVVPEVVRANKRHQNAGVKFILANAITDEMPAADVVLCREVLFHLSFADGLKALHNVAKRAKWIIATTDTSIWFNSDILTGDYRQLNLQFPPYRLPTVHTQLKDDALSRGRALGVWRAEDVLKAGLGTS